MKILLPTTITATVSATTTPTTFSSSQPPQSQQSQPFPLSPRLPSSQLHESLIMSKDGTIRAAPEVEPSEGKGEDKSDEEMSRRLEDSGASQKRKETPNLRTGNSLKRRRAFLSSDTDMSGDGPRSAKDSDSDSSSSSASSLPSRIVAQSYQKRRNNFKDREGPSLEQELPQAQAQADEPSLPVAKRQKLNPSTVSPKLKIKLRRSTRTPADKTKRRDEDPSLEQEIPQAQAHHDEPSLPVAEKPKLNSSTARPKPRLIKSGGISSPGSTQTPANKGKVKAKAIDSGPSSSTQKSNSTPNPSAGQAPSRETSLVTQTQVQKRLYKRHNTHWTLDGNVIVRISDVQYKLVRSVLAKQSRWFQSAFDTNTIEGEDENEDESGKEDEDERWGKGMEPVEQYNGCPVYVLDGIVRPRDFERLLDAMDAAITYAHDPPPFPVLASIIRASTALEFTHFKRYSRRVLEEKWTINLESFRKRISYPCTTILLSQECHIPSVLPRAMYELVKTNELDLHGILCGLDEADESEDDRDNDEGRPKLSQKLLFRLIQAREELATLWMREVSVPPSVEHVEPDKASNGGRAKTVSQDPIFVQYRYDFVCGLGEIIDIDWEGEGYCEACAAKRRKAWREMMRRWWKIFEEIVQN
ncbi:hypothetical protein K435DRAFT_760304 [Dendrothele bispora CBS 962.96]|uniref:BTB domain-containing protein n=1 Tax=Dendrothele bispora (strain CBS 962.96) TaxID=1314807 RepID=A0A4S8LNG5_DENBC|nr:hypothetical protein K435DRAFT_760304 [Dendrothele bispora CBS 962.96]